MGNMAAGPLRFVKMELPNRRRLSFSSCRQKVMTGGEKENRKWKPSYSTVTHIFHTFGHSSCSVRSPKLVSVFSCFEKNSPASKWFAKEASAYTYFYVLKLLLLNNLLRATCIITNIIPRKVSAKFSQLAEPFQLSVIKKEGTLLYSLLYYEKLNSWQELNQRGNRDW